MNLEGPYKAAYKRQMDMYLWIGKQRGYPMSENTYFLYVDGMNQELTLRTGPPSGHFDNLTMDLTIRP